MAPSKVTAEYQSPNGAQKLSVELPCTLPDAGNVKDKTAYLSALREGASELQSKINAFLTQKMEEDQALGSHAGNVREVVAEKEEQMYGEEDVEDVG